MVKVLAKRMSNTSVTSMNGTELGTAVNIVVDTRTGDLIDLVVKPNTATSARFKTEGNLMYIPFSAVRSARDYIIIDTKLADTLKSAE
ncbi:PRC-barrel domain protein [Candidatus Methanoperedenaceae archaeon GB37]|nr:PRC-barrel domain protein [Candidatus Methanoperedenaceae archaeon GB37]